MAFQLWFLPSTTILRIKFRINLLSIFHAFKTDYARMMRSMTSSKLQLILIAVNWIS